MTITKNLVDTSKYSLKCPYDMTAECIVIHNTYNDASAKNEISYMRSNSNQVSFHYAIDDLGVVQGIEENRNAWHAGDGATGKGNRKGIAIEICYSKNGGDKFIQAEKNAAQFTAQLLKKYGWDISKVTKHQDYSGKYCPHRTLDMGWARFIEMVQTYIESGEEVSSSSDTLYRVQVGAYSKKDNATAMAAKVEKAGFSTYLVQVDSLYKVQVGAFASKENAEKQKETLITKGFDAFVTTKTGTAVSTAATLKSITEIAKEVIAGLWGNGTDRKTALEAAGYDYSAVQAIVNTLV